MIGVSNKFKVVALVLYTVHIIWVAAKESIIFTDGFKDKEQGHILVNIFNIQ